MGHYDVAQICLNGHVITDSARLSPTLMQKYCDKCGEPTILECQSCKTPIRGYYHVEGVISIGDKLIVPSFCHECGKPYPWTERKLEAAWELADELEELNDDERMKLKNSLNDITHDTPKTELATTRLKKIMGKLGKESYSVVKQVLIELATEAAKKSLFG